MDRYLFAKTYQIGDKKYTMREIVKMESWQKLREKLVGTWTSPENRKKNVFRLRRWLGPARDASNKKLLIIRNYLTGSGFRWGNIQHPEITKFRKQVVEELKKRKNETK